MPEVEIRQAPPGTIVPSGTQVSPGGQQGTGGFGGTTETVGAFTVPNYGWTVVVTVADPSWLTVGQMVYVEGAGGSGQAGCFQVQAISTNQVTLLNVFAGPEELVSTDAGNLAELGSDNLVYVPEDLASTSGPGLMNTISGNATDYIGGDNASHPLISTDAGNIVKLGSDSHLFAPAVGRYYGADTTNTLAYAITVASDFTLVAGVVVSFTISIGNNAANPTLNVNGTGAKPVVNKANVALTTALELPVGTHLAVYDGTSWRVLSPLFRRVTLVNPGTHSIECAGFTSVCYFASVGTSGAAGSLVVTFQHVAYGSHFMVRILNAYASAASTYQIKATDVAGNAINCWWIWANTLAGAGATQLDAAATSISAGVQVLLVGGGDGQGYLLFL